MYFWIYDNFLTTAYMAFTVGKVAPCPEAPGLFISTSPMCVLCFQEPIPVTLWGYAQATRPALTAHAESEAYELLPTSPFLLPEANPVEYESTESSFLFSVRINHEVHLTAQSSWHNGVEAESVWYAPWMAPPFCPLFPKPCKFLRRAHH